MDKIFKIIRISEDGTHTMIPQFFHNSYGVLENAVTFNMLAHNVSNILDHQLRLKYREGIMIPMNLNIRERAYVTIGTDMYCISEVFENEKPKFSLLFQAASLVN